MGIQAGIDRELAGRIAAIAKAARSAAAPVAGAGAPGAAQVAAADANALERLRAANAPVLANAPELLKAKYQRMDADAFSFDRGNAPGFYDWLHQVEGDRMSAGPYTVVSGDMHMANLGTVERKGGIKWGPTDADEAVIGPARWDLERFAESIGQVGASLGLAPDKAQGLVGKFASAYRDTLAALAEGKKPPKALKAPAPVRAVLERAAKVDERAWIDKLAPLAAGKRQFARSERVTSATPAIDQAVRKGFASYLTRLPHDVAKKLKDYRVSDVVSVIAGVGSVGRSRYRLLLEARGRKPMVFELKEEGPAAAAAYLPYASPFANDAERAATLGRVLGVGDEAYLGTAKLPQAAAVQSPDFMVRRVLPIKGSLDLKALAPDDLAGVVCYEGKKIALAQARGEAIGLASAKELLAATGNAAAFAGDLQGFASAYDRSNADTYERFHAALRTDATLSRSQ